VVRREVSNLTVGNERTGVASAASLDLGAVVRGVAVANGVSAAGVVPRVFHHLSIIDLLGSEP
jgi:hypothetical protein